MSRLGLLRVANRPFETLAAFHAPELLPLVACLLDADDAQADEAQALSAVLFSAAGPPSEDPRQAPLRFLLLRLRRAVHNARALRPEDLAAARDALAPELFEHIDAHACTGAAREAARAAFEAAFDSALVRTRGELMRIAADPLVEHGIYLASRTLLPKAAALRRRDPGSFSHDQRHTAAKLAAYVARFATKTSPNGVFCAVGLARFEGGRLRLEGTPGIDRMEALLSLSEVRKVAACLAADASATRAVRPRANPTLRFHDGAWTFWRAASPRHEDDREVHVRIKDHPLLRLFHEETEKRARDPESLLAAVAQRAGLELEALRAFYRRLVDQGFLIAELEVPYSSRRRFRELAQIARAGDTGAPWIDTLERIEREVDALAALDPRERSAAMEGIVALVEPLPRNRPFKPEELFRIDSATSLAPTLPRRVVDDLSGPVRTFARLLAGIYPDELNQRVLHRRFLATHPPDTDIEFLDLYGSLAETADGEGERPLEFPAPEGTAPEGSKEAQALAAQRRVWEWFTARARESLPGEIVEVDDALVRRLVGDAPEPPWAAGALFQLAAESAADVDEGRYQLVLNALFNGIGLALARFAHLLGNGQSGPGNPVVAELRRTWKAMERPGAVLAELTFNHEARTANAGLRPVLFEHEIELPGDRTSPGVETIPLADLVARYDSKRAQLVLRSRARAVEIVPVLSSGVSPSGIVSELIHIGRQGWQTIGYLPGFEAPEIARWPRFVCGKLVLFRARWLFGEAQLPALSGGGAAFSEARFFLETARWRRRNGLPRHLFVHTRAEPKPFYVDLEAPILVDLLRRALAARRGAGSKPFLIATEMLPSPEQLWVRGPGGGHATEFLLQFEGASAVQELPADSSS